MKVLNRVMARIDKVTATKPNVAAAKAYLTSLGLVPGKVRVAEDDEFMFELLSDGNTAHKLLTKRFGKPEKQGAAHGGGFLWKVPGHGDIMLMESIRVTPGFAKWSVFLYKD